MTKGVFITSFDKKVYAYAAYNLAYSIKHFDSDIHITLCTDGNIGYLDEQRKTVFDSVISFPAEWKYTNGAFDPGNVKVKCFSLLPYDETLYLDADAVSLQSIKPIFEGLSKAGGYYYTHLYGTHTLNPESENKLNQWASDKELINHFGLKEGMEYPSSNTSIQWIKKCKESEALIKLIQQNFSNPIPLSKLKNQWGGCQPDELYVGASLAQTGITGQMPYAYMFFGNVIDRRNLDAIKSDHNILSVYGGKLYTRPTYTEWYDTLLEQYHRSENQSHIFKYSSFIVKDKHANKKPVGDLPIVQRQTEDNILPPQNGKMPNPKIFRNKWKQVQLIKADIPIEKTELIDASKLIRSYPNVKGKKINVTNWLNCSFIEYKGKKILCYRMESYPFCTVMKLAMCLLNDDLQPIENTNVLLELHSNLSGFAKGYHVEDPRLFIFNDELYLSYTDGYQMAQAKINPETLQAVESFYIDKPKEGTTEKNWTFFEYENELYSLYDISKMEVFKMNGPKWERFSTAEYKSSWVWGQLRGGTSPVKVGNNYLTFFHSALPIVTKGVHGRQYFMGAMLFEGKPPFKPIGISRQPILAGENISEGIPRLSNKIYVVFPGGLIRRESSWVVSFGYNDLQCRFVDISDEYLKNSFVKVTLNELVSI